MRTSERTHGFPNPSRLGGNINKCLAVELPKRRQELEVSESGRVDEDDITFGASQFLKCPEERSLQYSVGPNKKALGLGSGRTQWPWAALFASADDANHPAALQELYSAIEKPMMRVVTR